MSVEAVDENMNEREMRALILSNLTNQLFQWVFAYKGVHFFFIFFYFF